MRCKLIPDIEQSGENSSQRSSSNTMIQAMLTRIWQLTFWAFDRGTWDMLSVVLREESPSLLGQYQTTFTGSE